MGGFLSMLFGNPAKYDISGIQVGDSKEVVLAALGEPDKTTSGDYLGYVEDWEYSIPFRVYVSIKFDAKGQVVARYRRGDV